MSDPRVFYRPNWLAQFGLYRYESAEPRKPETKLGIGFYGGLALAFIFLMAIIFIATYEGYAVSTATRIEIATATSASEALLTTVVYPQQIDRSIADLAETTTPTAHHPDKTIMLFEGNSTERPIRPQKLVLPPRRFLTPPLVSAARKSDGFKPRPFDHALHGQQPAGFQRPTYTAAKVMPFVQRPNANNPQQQQQQLPKNHRPTYALPNRRNGRVKFAGTYRLVADRQPSAALASPAPVIGEVVVMANNRTKHGDHTFVADPFHNYKPKTLGEINLLATNQFRFAPHFMRAQPHVTVTAQSMPKNLLHPVLPAPVVSADFERMYHQIIAANSARMKMPANMDADNQDRAGGIPKNHRPFSLMLDIYPMHDEEGAHGKRYPKVTLRKPGVAAMFPSTPNAVIAHMPANHPMDTSYFNHISFPQLQHSQHPHTSPYLNNIHYRMPYMEPEASASGLLKHEVISPTMDKNKPSQMIVHLNLYPKNKLSRPVKQRPSPTYDQDMDAHKRSSQETGPVFDHDLYSIKNHPVTPATEVTVHETSYTSHYPTPVVDSSTMNFDMKPTVGANPFSDIRQYHSHGATPVAIEHINTKLNFNDTTDDHVTPYPYETHFAESDATGADVTIGHELGYREVNFLPPVISTAYSSTDQYPSATMKNPKYENHEVKFSKPLFTEMTMEKIASTDHQNMRGIPFRVANKEATEKVHTVHTMPTSHPSMLHFEAQDAILTNRRLDNTVDQ